MLRTLQSMALSICVLCTLAGMVRLFWPENSFKPVINSVLLLYILASALEMTAAADWPAFARQLRLWSSEAAAPQEDFSDYAQEISLQATAQAVSELLASSGIPAEVSMQGDVCRIALSSRQDYQQAQALLEAQGGTLAYRLEVAENDG